MDILIYIIIFSIGALIGSFCTLASYRIPLNKNITNERSFCPTCNSELSFIDLMPILSFVFLGGKCRKCKNKIGYRYIVMELFSGVIFTVIFASLKLDLFNIEVSKLTLLLIYSLYFIGIEILLFILFEQKSINKKVLLYLIAINFMYIVCLCIYKINYNTVVNLFIIIISTLGIYFLRNIKGKQYIISLIMIISIIFIILSNFILIS